MYRHPITTRTRRSVVANRPVPDWSQLSKNDAVQVARRDGTVTTGRIDMVALDRKIFWIIQDGGLGRVMVCSADRPQVTVIAPAKNTD